MKSAVLIAMLLAACSDNDSGTVSSCDLTADVGYCLDFAADAPSGEAQGNCDSANSTLDYHGVASADSSCPTANRVGTCDAAINGVDVTYRYYSPKWTSDTANTNCSGLPGGGTFTAN